MLRGHTYTLIPYLYTLTLNLYPDLFKSTTTLIPTLTPTLIPTTMAPTEKEWATIASKYRYRINADKASKNELVKFIQTTIYLYETQNLTDNNL